MTPVPRLLASAGSLREGSYNRRLIHVLAEGARAAGAGASAKHRSRLRLDLEIGATT